MDFKQAIIENAWGDFSMDYGLLHLQLATPLTVLVFILIMIFLLNKLLFQPVLRTLDQRKESIQGSIKQSERLSKELERMQMDFQQKLDETRKNVMDIHHSTRDEAINYVKKNEIEYYVVEPQKSKVIKKSYSDNFTK